MQIDTNIPQIDSREYKIILDPSNFSGNDPERDRIYINEILYSLTKNLNLKVEESLEKPKVKKVWYMDTKSHDLYQTNNFILRFKEKVYGNYKCNVTFKSRHSDVSKVLGTDLKTVNQNPSYKIDEQKFEEDILFGSEKKFSYSTELEYESPPPIDSLTDISSIFPKLNFGLHPTSKILKVNNLSVIETSHKLGKILLGDEKKAGLEVSIWCAKDESNKEEELTPIIAEFDIDIKSKDFEKGDQAFELLFVDPAIDKIEILLKEFQKLIPSDKNFKTKTDYMYHPSNQ